VNHRRRSKLYLSRNINILLPSLITITVEKKKKLFLALLRTFSRTRDVNCEVHKPLYPSLFLWNRKCWSWLGQDGTIATPLFVSYIPLRHQLTPSSIEFPEPVTQSFPWLLSSISGFKKAEISTILSYSFSSNNSESVVASNKLSRSSFSLVSVTFMIQCFHLILLCCFFFPFKLL
jgi:hypothetical protein